MSGLFAFAAALFAACMVGSLHPGVRAAVVAIYIEQGLSPDLAERRRRYVTAFSGVDAVVCSLVALFPELVR